MERAILSQIYKAALYPKLGFGAAEAHCHAGGDGHAQTQGHHESWSRCLKDASSYFVPTRLVKSEKIGETDHTPSHHMFGFIYMYKYKGMNNIKRYI